MPVTIRGTALTRNAALDFLKIILALMVVGMHTSFLTDVSPLAAYLANNGLFRIAVPIFLVINGYFFHRVASSGTSRTWFQRVLILYAIWMLIYLPFWLPDLHVISLSSLARIAHAAFFGYYHLWYLVGMLGAALMMAFMARMHSAVLLMAMAVTFVTGVAIQYAGAYQLLGTGIAAKLASLTWSHRNFLFFSFPFFCAGFLMHRHEIARRLSTPAIAATLAAGMAVLFLESYLNFSAAPAYGMDNLAALAIVGPAAFLLFMRLEIPSSSKQLAQYSTAIYLSHVMVIFGVQQVAALAPTVLTLVVTGVCAAVSCGLVALHRRFAFIL